MIIIGGDSNFDKNYYANAGADVTIWTDKIDTKNINVSGAGYSNLQIKNAVMNAIMKTKDDIEHVYVFWSEWSRIGIPYATEYHNYLSRADYERGNRSSLAEERRNWILANKGWNEHPSDKMINTNLNIFISMESFLRQQKIPYTFYQTDLPLEFEYGQEQKFAARLMNKPQFNYITWENFWGWPINKYLNGKDLFTHMKNQLNDEIALSKSDAHMNQKAHDFLANKMVDNRLKL